MTQEKCASDRKTHFSEDDHVIMMMSDDVLRTFPVAFPAPFAPGPA